MVTKIVLATRNAHKAHELARVLESFGLDIELLTIDAFPDAPEVAETEPTFEGNALLKARALAQHAGIPAISDDSGLCVNALNGMPGILSARWSGATENVDSANLNLVLQQITDVPDVRRGAQFVCAAALVLPDGREFTVRGTVEGRLIRETRGDQGFGYDPIFVPDGFDATTAQMSADEKDAISHRGKAMRALAQIVKDVLGSDSL
jgi:XTP/dITP diphosphohydrolase